MSSAKRILLYGSYGYTGSLIARFAKEQGADVVLAGRNLDAVHTLARLLGLQGRVFDLTETSALLNALQDIDVVIHCAGPFSHTYRAVAEACLHTGTHYTDITGEAEVFEGLSNLDTQAKKAGIMLLPGTGFDVVPSDCLAAHLKSRCPEATHLELAFRGRGGGVSHGTAMTMAENFHKGGLVRVGGALKKVPTAWKTRSIDFGDGKPVHCMTIPWGDVVTAYTSTGIPNIRVYTHVARTASTTLRLARPLLPLLATDSAQRALKKRISSRPPGPDDETRASSVNELWGEARDAAGNVCVSRLRTPEGYTLTATMALSIARRIARGEFTPGFQTPSTAYGKDLILECEGTERVDEEPLPIIERAVESPAAQAAHRV